MYGVYAQRFLMESEWVMVALMRRSQRVYLIEDRVPRLDRHVVTLGLALTFCMSLNFESLVSPRSVPTHNAFSAHES